MKRDTATHKWHTTTFAGIGFGSVNVLANEHIRQGIKEYRYAPMRACMCVCACVCVCLLCRALCGQSRD